MKKPATNSSIQIQRFSNSYFFRLFSSLIPCTSDFFFFFFFFCSFPELLFFSETITILQGLGVGAAGINKLLIVEKVFTSLSHKSFIGRTFIAVSFFALYRFCVFYKFKICGNPALRILWMPFFQQRLLILCLCVTF